MNVLEILREQREKMAAESRSKLGQMDECIRLVEQALGVRAAEPVTVRIRPARPPPLNDRGDLAAAVRAQFGVLREPFTRGDVETALLGEGWRPSSLEGLLNILKREAQCGRLKVSGQRPDRRGQRFCVAAEPPAKPVPVVKPAPVASPAPAPIPPEGGALAARAALPAAEPV